jgi:predicted small lipoprotein YifL
MGKRTIVALAVLVIISAALAGCGNSKPLKIKPPSVPTTPSSASSSAGAESSAAPVAPPNYAPQNNTLEGKGTQTTRSFVLVNGAKAFAFQWAGAQGGFEATLVNTANKQTIKVISAQGASSAQTERVNTTAGTYEFQVTAPQSTLWTIDIQP